MSAHQAKGISSTPPAKSSTNNAGLKKLFLGMVLGIVIAEGTHAVRENYMYTNPAAATTMAQQNENSIILSKQQQYYKSNSKPVMSYPIHHNELRTSIREWGCGLRQTPFIFVHIGKAGGGSVRARIAASSVNYTKGKNWKDVDGSYYPLLFSNTTTNAATSSSSTNARFCNSCFTNRRPSSESAFEGTMWCHATTPIGKAIACPEGYNRRLNANDPKTLALQECNVNSTTCHIVYAGHNWMGAEFHWLPHRMLKQWWDQLILGQQTEPVSIIPWHRLDPENQWCDAEKISRIPTNLKHRQYYENCSIPMAREVDSLASVALSEHHDGIVPSWAPLYASLPVLRVTVLRDPFSWLTSKFLWHSHAKMGLVCDNITSAVGPGTTDIPRTQDFKKYVDGPRGWVGEFCMVYLFFLCGEDCAVRYASGRANLEELAHQAEENLRHSFAVVGILEELDNFYPMINARVQYIDTSLNSDVEDGNNMHGTSKAGEAQRCKDRFKDAAFQQALLDESPELRVVHRLYQVAKEVKNFQKQELQKCAPKLFPTG